MRHRHDALQAKSKRLKLRKIALKLAIVGFFGMVAFNPNNWTSQNYIKSYSNEMQSPTYTESLRESQATKLITKSYDADKH